METCSFKFSKVGGPEVLEWTQETLGRPAAGQLQVRHEAIGVNYIDVYHRTGAYPVPLPSGIGVEGVGIVEGVGPGVEGFSVGDRVAYAGGPPGAYSTARNVPAARSVKVPAGVSAQVAASLFFKGLTVEYLIRRCFPVQDGQDVLFHAAAGGVGLIACQWLKALGANVIGSVSSDEKAALVKENGCTHAINSLKENVAERVKDITNGDGVAVVYDSIGAQTFADSLDSLRPRGTLVSFGTASGPVNPFDLGLLGAKGSLFVTRPSIAHYTTRRGELDAGAAAVFEAIQQGTIKPIKLSEYALKDARKAHEDLEARKTMGSLILVP